MTKVDIQEEMKSIIAEQRNLETDEEPEGENDGNDDDQQYRRQFMDIALVDSSSYGTVSELHFDGETGMVKLAPPEGFVLLALIPERFLSSLLSAENGRMDDCEMGVVEKELIGKSSTDITLDSCFDEFSREEQLGEDDAWYCPQCKKHQQATKKLDLWRLPEILVIHLKRFSHTRWNRDKLENMVDFPLRGLDLLGRIRGGTDGEAIYDLFAVSNHYGGLGGGHYTAYAMNMTNQRWYDFDDSRVTEMRETEVNSKNAYMLFYRRRRDCQNDDGKLSVDNDLPDSSGLSIQPPHANDGCSAVDSRRDTDIVSISSEANSITVHTEDDHLQFFSPVEAMEEDESNKL